MVRPRRLFSQEGDEAEQDLRAHLQAERMAVSRLGDEPQRLVGHVQSLQVQLRAERAAVSRLEEEVQGNGVGIHAAEDFGAQGEEQL